MLLNSNNLCCFCIDDDCKQCPFADDCFESIETRYHGEDKVKISLVYES